MPSTAVRQSVLAVPAAYAGFAAFGAFWGAWGASLPAVREQAGLSDGQLGTALLFIGVGALPAMLLAGRAVDRWAHHLTAPLLLGLGCTGVGVALTGHGLVSLSLGMAVLGAVSGATDVAINTDAGTAERASTGPVITRAHGVFSAAVVASSLTTGALHGGGAATAVPFLVVAAVAVAAGVVTLVAARTAAPASSAADRPRAPEPALRRAIEGRRLRALPLVTVGGLGALAFAVENAHQSWSAIYLADVLSAGPAVAAAGPAVFAAVVALTRFAAAMLDPTRATAVLVAGAATAAAGTTLLATAASLPVALVGLGVAAAGTAVLYPTLLSLVSIEVPAASRGAATSVVATVAYLGFLAGPVYVGRWSSAVSLPGAMLAVAGLAAVLAALAWLTRRTRVATPRALAAPCPAPPAGAPTAAPAR